MGTSFPYRPAVLAALWAMSQAAFAKPQFVTSILDPGVSMRQTVLWADLDNSGRADLIVTAITARGRDARVYAQDDDGHFGERPVAAFALPNDVIMVDTGRLAGRDVLILFTADEAVAYDVFTGKQTRLIRFHSMFRVPISRDLPKMDLFRDLNGDGRDDFAIPDFAGYEIFLQRQDGSFSTATQLAAAPEMRLDFNEQPDYEARQLFLADMTLDHKPDIVFWRHDGFVVYRQLPDGSFSDHAILDHYAGNLAFEANQDYSSRMRGEDQSKLTTRILYQLRDLDNDGMPDLVTLTIKSGGLFNKQTVYGIYKGRKSPESDLVTFAESPTSTITSHGIQFDMKERDLDRDGQQDIMVSSVRLGLARIIEALITRSVGIDLDFYEMQDGVYPSKPNATRGITATFSLSSGSVFYPFVLVADVDGDHYADLLVQRGTDTLMVYPGRKGPRLFDRRSVNFKVNLPSDPDMVEVMDLNGDGRDDIVMRLEKKNHNNHVVVMVAK